MRHPVLCFIKYHTHVLLLFSFTGLRFLTHGIFVFCAKESMLCFSLENMTFAVFYDYLDWENVGHGGTHEL